jgi:hypothetical protein
MKMYTSIYLGAFNDVDRTFLSEHAALGLENQQLQVRDIFRNGNK